IERCVAASAAPAPGMNWRHTLPLGLACTALVLCGHPQLPIYILLASGAYALWRLRGRARLMGAGAMLTGAGGAAFALIPMSLLVARSTRALTDIEKAPN